MPLAPQWRGWAWGWLLIFAGIALLPLGAWGAISGTAIFPSAINLTPLSNPVGVAVADLDGDGWVDVVGSGNNVEKIIWWRNNGAGGFVAAPYTVTTSPSTAAFSNVALDDLNLDGRPDVIYWSGTSILWSPNLGGSDPAAQFGYNAGNQTANQFFIATTGTPETNVATADMNGDGRPDILSVTGSPDKSVAWVPNLVSGFGSRVVLSTAPNDPTTIQGVDLDQDGLRDVLITSVSDNSVSYFRNLGSGTFGTRVIVSNGVSFARSASFGEVNGDGRPDLACLGNPFAATTARWFLKNAPGVNPLFNPTANTVTNVTNGGYVNLLRDMNSDGLLDVVVLATNLGQVFWCENLGAGSFGNAASNQKLVGSGVGFPISMQVADLDQSGTLDVIVNANSQARVNVYLNKGGQTAMTTADTAPGTLMEGKRDDALKIDVSHRGIAGNSQAQLDTMALKLESSPGVSLNSAQANALLDRVAVHLDADSSGTFDPANDPAVATVSELTLTNGVLSVPFSGSAAASIQIAPATTRTYFVVPKIAEFAAAQSPNTVRVSHLSHGTGRSVVRDATTSAALTIESNVIVNAPSALITAQPAHTYTDHAFLYFDSATDPGTAPADDFDFDGNANLIEFGFGMVPTVSGSPVVSVSGGVLVQRGLPIALATNTGTGVTYEAVFVRRKDPLAGLTYTVQFSATLSSWVASTATPTVLADDGVYEAVAVPYPFFVNGRKARFFRVLVTSP
jgi:hypothetical protein